MRALAQRVGTAVVKLGSGGAFWSDGAQLVRRPALSDVDAVDTTGAGDAFAAGYLAGVLRGDQVGRALDRGHELAARACGVVGGRPPRTIAFPRSATLQP